MSGPGVWGRGKGHVPRGSRRTGDRPLLERNRSRMVMQAMLKQGATKEKAEQRVGLNLDLLRYLGHGRLVVRDDPDATRFQVKLDLSK